MIHVPVTFHHAEDGPALVKAAEARYLDALDRATVEIAADMQIQIITVTGPTCSGKTTTSHILMEKLAAAGRPVYMVSFDDFYINRADLPLTPEGRVDYDTEATLDMACLRVSMEHLLHEEPVDLPVYDFVAGKRGGYRRYVPQKDDIVLFEGIQAMYPGVLALLPPEVTRHVAIMPWEDVQAGDATFSAREIRLLRRLVRDIRTRGASAQHTLSMWEDVTRNEDCAILPHMTSAHIHIDTFLPYELSVIRPMAEAVLDTLPPDSEFASVGRSLCERLSQIEVLPPAYVPRGSMFREFIGDAGIDGLKA